MIFQSIMIVLIVFGFIKKMFIGLLSFSEPFSMVNVSNHTKCISLSNQPFMTIPTLVDLNLDEYNHYQCITIH